MTAASVCQERISYEARYRRSGGRTNNKIETDSIETVSSSVFKRQPSVVENIQLAFAHTFLNRIHTDTMAMKRSVLQQGYETLDSSSNPRTMRSFHRMFLGILR